MAGELLTQRDGNTIIQLNGPAAALVEPIAEHPAAVTIGRAGCRTAVRPWGMSGSVDFDVAKEYIS